MLGYTDFTCTTGWLDQFDARHNIYMYYEDIDTAAITSDVPTMDDIVNDIHCDKQENGDDSDADTATVANCGLHQGSSTKKRESISQFDEISERDHRFIEATENADEGIVEVISSKITDRNASDNLGRFFHQNMDCAAKTAEEVVSDD
ncbi:hypothetical protein T01_10850 [Trichinella spiralis]|uniref:HTH CENPB-type domain-containing protein n=1 Tax=Trichinella spiralis TaxID=6334 RepID=A0A0V1BXS5_TRISP|nr:hypothetical protein T01_10850 [Trichinella spiralis]